MGVAQTKDKDKGQSVTLDLKEKPLDKWLAEAKGMLKQIERLDLSRQELAELPPQIAKLVNLKVLQAYDNHLKAIPKEIGTKTLLVCLSAFSPPVVSFCMTTAITPTIESLCNSWRSFLSLLATPFRYWGQGGALCLQLV